MCDNTKVLSINVGSVTCCVHRSSTEPFFFLSLSQKKGSVDQRGHHCSAFAGRELSTCVHQAKNKKKFVKNVLLHLVAYAKSIPADFVDFVFHYQRVFPIAK